MAGNKNSGKRKDKAFHTAIMLEIGSAESGRDLRAIARNVMDVALDKTHKDMLAAASFIADRVDGKPVATVDMNLNDNRTVEELPDSDLVAILREESSGARVAEAPDSAAGPDSVH